MHRVEYNKFPTHLPYTKNKKVPDKYVKINTQSIYNGKVARFSRNVVMHNMHTYLLKQLKGLEITEFPIKITLEYSTVINHGDITRRHTKDGPKIIWNPPKEGYEPRNDLDNLSWIWIKAFGDALKVAKCIPEDNLNFIRSYEVRYKEVEEFDDRKLTFIIENV